MLPKMNLSPGKIYCIDTDGNKTKLESAEKIDTTAILSNSDFIKNVKSLNSTITLLMHPTYKKKYTRRKGKRYLPYYKKVYGIYPNILKKNNGGE